MDTEAVRSFVRAAELVKGSKLGSASARAALLAGGGVPEDEVLKLIRGGTEPESRRSADELADRVDGRAGKLNAPGPLPSNPGESEEARGEGSTHPAPRFLPSPLSPSGSLSLHSSPP